MTQRRNGIILLLALAFTTPAVAGPTVGQERDLGEILEGYRALAPDDGFYIADRTARVGHLALRFDRGRLFPLKGGGGEVRGLFFEGQGSYAYTSEDPADLQVLRSNLARRSRAGLLREGVVRDDLERMVLFFAAPLFEELWEEDADDTERPAAAEAMASFRKIWGRVVANDLGFDHLAAEAELNGGDAQYVFAEIEGTKDTVGYAFDRIHSYYEHLISFRRVLYTDVGRVRVMDNLSQQLVDGGPSKQWPVASLQEALLDVVTENNRSGTVASDLTLVAGRDGVRALRLRLLNNRDAYSDDWSSDRNQLRLVRVSDPEGRQLPFSHRYNEVLVQLPGPVSRGDSIRIRFEAEGDFFTSRFGERDDNYFELFLGAWYPRPFVWGTEKFTCTLRVKTRKPFRPVASGKMVSLKEEGKFYELETRGTMQPTQIAVFAGKYKTKEQELHGKTIRVHAYAMASDKALTTLIGLSDYFLSYFEHVLGPYPFEELDVVEVPLWGFGIAPAGMVLLTSEAYNPMEDFLSQYFSRGINSRLAHEIAHQWFGHKASPASQRDNWLSESFAEYLSGMAMAVAQPDERQVAGFRRMHEEWWRQAKYCKDAGPITAANMLSGDMAYHNRFGLLYNRGPLVLHMLRTYVGDEAFFAVLRHFLEEADKGPATTEDFERAAAEVLGDDLTWFFEQWVHQGGIPELKVEHRVETAENGELVLVGRAEVVGGPLKKVYIPFVLEFKNSERQARFLLMDEAVEEFRFPLPETPTRVAVDPSRNNLVIYR